MGCRRITSKLNVRGRINPSNSYTSTYIKPVNPKREDIKKVNIENKVKREQNKRIQIVCL